MGSRLKGKRSKPDDRLSSWRVYKMSIYTAVTLLVLALLWYYYLG